MQLLTHYSVIQSVTIHSWFVVTVLFDTVRGCSVYIVENIIDRLIEFKIIFGTESMVVKISVIAHLVHIRRMSALKMLCNDNIM